mmetsp:Transcript_15504/g.35455  ORF Transcript_15504/g.35455 Transcript_15504/m.35455 type:complete len:264 (+) Transcript_15504:71-862(+)
MRVKTNSFLALAEPSPAPSPILTPVASPVLKLASPVFGPTSPTKYVLPATVSWARQTSSEVPGNSSSSSGASPVATFQRQVSPLSPKPLLPVPRMPGPIEDRGSIDITLTGLSTPVGYSSGPSTLLASVSTSPVAAQTASPTSSWGVSAWTTVPSAGRKPKKQGPGPEAVHVVHPVIIRDTVSQQTSVGEAAKSQRPEAPCEDAQLGDIVDGGGSADMYYELQDCSSTRGWSRAMKQTRSVKAQRKISYQVERRQAQSSVSRG